MFVDGVSDWNAFGYNNNRLVAVSVSAKQARAIKLDAQGQPEATAINQFDASAASDCAQIERGYFANLRSKPGQYAMFSFEKASITKVAEFPIKIDGMLKGLIPAPKQGGGVPTWAFAYSDRKNGLWAVELPGESSEGGDKKQASRRAGIIGGAVGGVAAVIVVILAVFFWHHKRNQKKSSESQTQDEPQLPENNHPTSVNANGMTLPADNNEVKGDGHLPKIEEPPLPPLPQEALSQSQQHLHSQPQLQSYTLSYPHAFPQQYPQQYPQPAPHLDQMYHAYPQPQMYQNSMQQHQQPYPSTAAYTAPTTIPTLATVPASTADAPALTATPTTIPVVSNNSAPAEPLQQELQFSNHPRPNVATTVGGANPLTAANLPMTAGL
ncbi:hypothetical protein BGW41_006498 [Actinomortierella wolfii]|nr:hypothetical protein BGW41_006498 [Actinomortierella wolfii]